TEQDYQHSAYGGTKPSFDYGRKKVLCEQVVQEVFAERSLILRLGWMAGPHNTAHLSYWARRILRGGKVLVPQAPTEPMQCLDARDLAIFLLRALSQGLGGIYNAVGERVTWKTWLVAWQSAINSGAVDCRWLDYHWVERQLALHSTTAFAAIP